MIRGLKFVSIPVRNQDASLKFFTEKLGFKVATDQEFSPTQRWIELLIPWETDSCFSRRMGMRIASEIFSPYLSGATTYLRPQKS